MQTIENMQLDRNGNILISDYSIAPFDVNDKDMLYS